MILRVICLYLLLIFYCQPVFSEQNGQIKNVILFIGDGMHLEHEIAASLYLTGENTSLAWHKFPYVAFVSTWDVDTYNEYAKKLNQKPFNYNKFYATTGYDPDEGGFMPSPLQKNINKEYFLPDSKNAKKGERIELATDSAAAATAMATGLKTTKGNISWLADDMPKGNIKTIMELVREKKGASIGVITTAPFNHATPAAFVAHNKDRNNYYTGLNDNNELGIADEIIKITKPDVVIGGGHPKFTSKLFYKQEKYLNKELYKQLKSSNEYVFVERKPWKQAKESLLNASKLASDKNLKLFGLYGGPFGYYEFPKPLNKPANPKIIQNKENPSLADSVIAGLNALSQNDKGFFLMAEQGTIDIANHLNNYKAMIGTVADLNEAVKAAIYFVDKPNDNINWDNTLLIVTSDHANSYMRIKKPEKLCKGCLPKQRNFIKKSVYPGEEIEYGSDWHTNELVCIYVKGNKLDYFKEAEVLWYPGAKIIDNTMIFDVLNRALGLEYNKREVLDAINYIPQ